MWDWPLQAAGALGIFAAAFHGLAAEFQVFPTAAIEPRGTRRLLRIVWQVGVVDWMTMGVLLIAVPAFGSPVARRWVIAAATLVYGCAAIGNAIAMRGRHFGWLLLTCVVALALLGL